MMAKVNAAIDELRYNSAIAALMEFAREVDREAAIGRGRRRDALALIQHLAPFAPHVAEELWERLGQSGSVHATRWPDVDPHLAAEQTVTIAIQINGRLRGSIEVPAGTSADELQAQALSLPRVHTLLDGRQPRKVIAVVDRVVNVVV